MGTGRKKKSLVDVMRTKLWLAEMMRMTGTENINQFGELLGSVDTKKMLYGYRSGKYTVSKKALADIDAILKGKGFVAINGPALFHNGPPDPHDPSAFLRLWDALDGSIEDASDVLLSYDPAMAMQKYLGVSFRLRCAYLTIKLFSSADPHPYWEEAGYGNVIAEAYLKDDLTVDMDVVIFAIAAWRIAHFIGDAQTMMNYILIGLLDKAIPDAMERYGVGQDMFQAIYELDSQHLSELDEAFKDFNYDGPIYPVTKFINEKTTHKGYEQPDTHEFLVARIKRESVATYLESKVKKKQSNADDKQPPAQATPSVPA